MLREMKAMPPPLTAIVTPRVEAGSHMGNMSRFGEPKYSFSPMLPALLKPIESPPRNTKVNLTYCRVYNDHQREIHKVVVLYRWSIFTDELSTKSS